MDHGSDLWVGERACQYGDGLFETVATVNGRPCLWRQHVDRLEMGCRRLSLPRPDVAALEAILDSLCRQHATRGVRVFWTAGRSERGYRRAPKAPPTGVVQPFPWAPGHALATLRLTRCSHRLSENPRLAGIKHLNRLDQVLARAEWDDPSIDEGLMLGQDGRIVCGTRSNIVLEKNGRLTTPDLGSAGVAGVVRQCLIEEGRRSANPVLVSRVTPEQLFTADAVYLTNALTGVARVGCIDDVQFDTGRAIHPLLASVHELALRATAG
jgi:4-amino-4-deoxychorismate lyase